MKKWKQLLVVMLAAVLTLGALQRPVIASEDTGAVVETPGSTEMGTEEDLSGTETGSVELLEEGVRADNTAGEAAAEFVVTLDANGGCFIDAWDDELNGTVERAEVLHRIIPAGETVDTFPIMEKGDEEVQFLGWSLEQDGQLVSLNYEKFAPSQSCVLYAVWDTAENTDENPENTEEDFSGNSQGIQLAEEEQQGAAESSSEISAGIPGMEEDGAGDEEADFWQGEEPGEEEVSPEQSSDIEEEQEADLTDGDQDNTDPDISVDPDQELLEEPGTDPDQELPEEPETDPDQELIEEPETDPDQELSEEPGTDPDQELSEEPETDPDQETAEGLENELDQEAGEGKTAAEAATADDPSTDPAENEGEKTGEGEKSGGEEQSGEEPAAVTEAEEETDSAGAMAYAISGTLLPGRTSVPVSAGQTVYYSFTPRYTGDYEFTSQSDSDTYGYLYTSSQYLIAYNDDGGEGYNFDIKATLTGGTTYCLGIKYYSSTLSGSIPVIAASCGSEGINSVSVSTGETAYFAFTPTVSGNYIIYSGSSHDTCGYLFDSNWNQLSYNDDGGYENNFSITCSLTAGATYYVGARYYYSSTSGNIKIAAAPLCEGTYINVESKEGQPAYFAFIAPDTGRYEFYSKNGDSDTMGSLYGVGLSQVNSDDDGGIGHNFRIARLLGIGNTYLVGARFYDSSLTGSISVYAGQYMGSCGSSLTWKLGSWKSADYNRTLTISGTGTMWDYDSTTMNQPWSYEDYYIDKIVVGSGVTSIGKAAFQWLYNVEKVSLPSSLVSIGDSAFQDCHSLKSITIPKSVTSIGSNAFSNCSQLVISGYWGSKAQSYAKANGITFRCLDKAPISRAKVTVTSPVYTGKVLKPLPVVKMGNTTLKKDKDYQVFYKNNKNAGKATLTLKGIGKYTGSKSVSFTIRRRSIKKAKVTAAARVYNGKARKSAPTVKVGSRTLKLGTDYSVSFKNNKNAGKATIIITGKNNYSGRINATFTIKKASPRLVFSKKLIIKEKNNNAFTNKLTRTTDGKISFSSSNKNVATVSSTTGKVTIRGKGKTVITVRAAAGKNYKSGKASYRLTVLKPNALLWTRDNWNFENSDYYFGGGTYYDQIDSYYLNKLINNLTPSEYEEVYSDYWLFDSWGGSCYGMAASELLAKEKLLPYGSYESGATKLSELSAPVYNSKVSSLITYYQMLQVKDAVQQVYYRTGRRGNKENIQSILRSLDKHSTVVVGFSMYGGGHAILAYEYKYGNYEWFGKKYQGCIMICDPNYSMGYTQWANIYFNTNTYDWIIPAYRESMTGTINFVSADKKELNAGGCLRGNSAGAASDYVARMNTYEVQDNHSVLKIRNAGDSYVTFDTGSGDIEKADYFVMNGGNGGGTPGYNLYDSSSSYRFTQSPAAPLKLSLKYESCYLQTESEAGATVVFDQSGFIETKGKAAKHCLTMTCDRDYPTDWFTVEVSGNSGKRLSLRKTEEGYVVSGDQLKNITVSANNKDEKAAGTLSTSAKEALICQKTNGEMDFRIDADHNGTYEKSVTGK